MISEAEAHETLVASEAARLFPRLEAETALRCPPLPPGPKGGQLPPPGLGGLSDPPPPPSACWSRVSPEGPRPPFQCCQLSMPRAQIQSELTSESILTIEKKCHSLLLSSNLSQVYSDQSTIIIDIQRTLQFGVAIAGLVNGLFFFPSSVLLSSFRQDRREVQSG